MFGVLTKITAKIIQNMKNSTVKLLSIVVVGLQFLLHVQKPKDDATSIWPGSHIAYVLQIG